MGSRVVTRSPPLPFLSSTSPRLFGRPSGEMAHSTYVMYSGPYFDAGSRFLNVASTDMTPPRLATFAWPDAFVARTVPRKPIFPEPPMPA